MSETPKPSSPPPPNSWLYLLLGFTGLAVAAVLTAALVARYFYARPIDLVPHTRYLAQQVQGLLESNRIPADDVTVSGGKPKQNDTAVWRYYDIAVNVPSSMSADGLERLLRRDMAQRKVFAKVDDTGANSRKLELSFSGHVFAGVELRGGHPMGHRRRDLTVPTQRLAKQAHDLLQDALPDTGKVETHIPEQRQSEEAQWSFTRLDVELP